MTGTSVKPVSGGLGLALGAAALLVAVVHFWAGPFADQPAFEESVAEAAVSIKEATVAALKGEEREPVATPGSWDIDQWVTVGTAVLGCGAIILGVLGFVRHEPLRPAVGASALGASAVIFQFLAAVAMALIFAIVVAAVVSQLDFFDW